MSKPAARCARPNTGAAKAKPDVIVQRAQAAARRLRDMDSPIAASFVDQAAAEIERLRADNAVLRAALADEQPGAGWEARG